jgi:hypothetical protein
MDNSQAIQLGSECPINSTWRCLLHYTYDLKVRRSSKIGLTKHQRLQATEPLTSARKVVTVRRPLE